MNRIENGWRVILDMNAKAGKSFSNDEECRRVFNLGIDWVFTMAESRVPAHVAPLLEALRKDSDEIARGLRPGRN